jgi:sialate O-acetylesterase
MFIQKRLIAFIILTLSCLCIHTKAEIRLPSFYTSNMVLQRDKGINLYGWATPGEKIKISLAGKQHSTKTDASGKWNITLPPLAAGGPYQLEFTGKNKIVLNDVLIGDVWFCSGQSNMGWKLGWLPKERANSSEFSNTNIRIITIPETISSVKEIDTKPTTWKVFTPENALDFSAVAAHFGKLLQPEVNVPIGLIASAWGGTDIEAWMTADALSISGKHNTALQQLSEIGDAATFEIRAKLAAKLWDDTTSRFDPGMVEKWYATGVNDNNWQTAQLPITLRDLGVNEQGNVWFRKTFSLAAADTVAGLLITLGNVGTDADVYFNGSKLARPINLSGNYYYTVPATLLVVGNNEMAIKVLRRWGIGGFRSKPEQMYAASAARILSLAGDWKYKTGYLAPNPAQMSGPNYFPSSLFNGMVHPLTSMPVKGVIWYQGENNTNRSNEYAWNLQSLIKEWRRYWQNEQLPFLVVQLPNYSEDDTAKKYWKQMRAAQQEATTLPAVGIVVTYDIGDSTNVHPVNKYDVGKRLSLLARKMFYGQNNIVAEGPKVSQVYADGDKLIVQFNVKQKEEQLIAIDKYGYAKGFEVAGADKQYYLANAQIGVDKITLSAKGVSKPVWVRYAWADNPDANLFNVYGLPAAPFIAAATSAK